MKSATRKSFTNLFKIGLMASRSSFASSALVGDSAVRSYQLNNKLCLTVAQGSVVDFASKKGAIVNAANEGCLGGGGVDGAITNAGGPNLAYDREQLPLMTGGIRCPTGQAKLTGPGMYGALQVPYVIHAVGPNYFMFDEELDVETPNRLLRSAYQSALDCTMETPIKEVAFALLSAGVFRGDQSLSDVLCIGVEAIRDWSSDESKTSKGSLEDIVLYAFTDRETRTLVKVCNKLLITPSSPSDVDANESESENGDDEQVKADANGNKLLTTPSSDAEANENGDGDDEQVKSYANGDPKPPKSPETKMGESDENEKTPEAKQDPTSEGEKKKKEMVPEPDPVKEEQKSPKKTKKEVKEDIDGNQEMKEVE